MNVEIWSDIVCPWCAIGKRRFERALDQFAHADQVEVRWRSFELDQTAPVERSGSLTEHLAAKYGTSREDAQAMQDHMTRTAALDGWEFRFDRARGGNTFDAHRVLHLAHERGLQDEVKERFLTAYLTEGEPIGDPATLASLAADAGLDGVEVKAVLAGQAYSEEVRADEEDARRLGISAVPFFVIDRAYGVSGAQPADVLLEALERAWDAGSGLTVLGPKKSAACDDEGCAI